MSAPEIDPLADGLLLRLGKRENAQSKSARYLVTGRVQIRRVDERGVLASVRGDGHLWTVVQEHGLWACDCPARSTCSHLLAVRAVVVVE